MRAPATFGAAAALLAFAPSPAVAADDVDLPAVVRVACAGIASPEGEKPLPLSRLAEAILFQAGFPPSRLLGEEAVATGDYGSRLVAAIKSPPPSMDAATQLAIRHYVEYLGEGLGPESNVTAKTLGIKVVSRLPEDAPARRRWLFEDSGTVKLACMPSKKAVVSATPTTDSLDEETLVPRFGIVKKVEDLSLTEDDRKKADSASVGFKRVRTTADDGTLKTTTSLTFDGTLGVRITGPGAAVPSFAYANYSLSRDRVKPAPPLGPNERRDDNDTHGLALGLAIEDIPLPWGGLSVQTAYVFDFVKNSRRGVGSFLLQPGWSSPDALDLGLCRFGALKTIDLGVAAFRTQCYLAGQVDVSHVFRVGRAKFKERGDFLSAGIVVGLDLAPPIFEKSGVVGSLRYRYLPTVSGTAPDVSRWDASLKYRWWLVGGGAFDVGFTYKHGEELKTYTRENSLELSLGVIF